MKSSEYEYKYLLHMWQIFILLAGNHHYMVKFLTQDFFLGLAAIFNQATHKTVRHLENKS